VRHDGAPTETEVRRVTYLTNGKTPECRTEVPLAGTSLPSNLT
jgi:hypothetical protein